MRLRIPARTQFDSAASAVIDAMSTSMPATATRKVVINNLVLALKAAGIWSLLDNMWVLAAHAPAAALLNWKSPGTYTAIVAGTITWQADRGYTGNGTDGRLRTQFTPSTQGVNFALDSASLWTWSLTEGNTLVDMGVGANNSLALKNASNNFAARINGTGQGNVANASAIGMFGASRASSTTIKAWKNGVQLGTDLAVASSALSPSEQWLCGASASNFSDKQIAFGAFGAALTGREAAFYSAVLAYMQAVGAVA